MYLLIFHTDVNNTLGTKQTTTYGLYIVGTDNWRILWYSNITTIINLLTFSFYNLYQTDVFGNTQTSEYIPLVQIIITKEKDLLRRI